MDSEIVIPDAYEICDSFGKFVTRYQDEENSEYFIVCLCGGLNGPGEWTNYFDDLKQMMVNFGKDYETWIVMIDNDCCDDVHYVYLGLREKQ